MSVFRRGIRVLSSTRPAQTLRKAAASIGKVFGPKTQPGSVTQRLTQRRIRLGRRLERQLGGRVVQYGAFQGMRLSRVSGWNKADLASMLLGMYEKEVVQYLANLSDGAKENFVNVGAGEGYFAIGMLHAEFSSRTICFEMSERSRVAIRDGSSLARIDQNLTLFGLADENFLDQIEGVDDFEYHNSVFLFDVEGAELELLTDDGLRRMARATIVIETHATMVSEQGQMEFEKLCSKYHRVSEIRTEGRNPGEFSELEFWPDNDRWAICSEGRPGRGRWLVLSPNN